AVGTLGTIIATVDGGSTWSEQAASVKVDDDGVKELLNAVSFPDPQRGYAVGLAGTILATSDGGATWVTQQPPPPLEYEGQRVEWAFRGVSFADQSVGYITGGPGGILKTANGGATWEAFADARFGQLMAVTSIDATNGHAVGWSGQVKDGIPFVTVATADAGRTWEPRPGQFRSDVSPLNFNAVAFSDPMHGHAVGDEGRIVATADGGKTWALQRGGAIEILTGVAFTDARRGLAVGTVNFTTGEQKAVVFATDDGGQSWVSRIVPETVRLRGGVDFADRTKAYAVGCRSDGPDLPDGERGCASAAMVQVSFVDVPDASSGSSGVPWLVVAVAVAAGLFAAAVGLRRRSRR
ncbi:MAG: WD40/YVTN/BNR-like repeat-containing protein, partial [Acidimicrobiales bacterium]